MTHQPPHDLWVSERPIRSDYARERSYARRRVVTLIVLALVIGATGYALWGRGPVSPADIPTIKAEGGYKQKPANPGGIDIPHQDVHVYDSLEGKGAPQAQIEHLLAPPEVPQDVPHAAPPPKADIVLSEAAPNPTDATEGLEPAIPAEPEPLAPVVAKAASVFAPSAPVAVVPQSSSPPPSSVAKKTASAKPKALPAPVAETLTIDQVLKQNEVATPAPTIIQAPTPATTPTPPPITVSAAPVVSAAPAPPVLAPSAVVLPKPVIAPGSAAVQLASVPDQAQAQSMAKNLQQKYASALGDAVLRVVRADLGSRGIYYRIQSQGLAEGEANQICSSLKQIRAGCILVRK